MAVAAHAYERHSCSFLTDESFDALALRIDPLISTGHPILDRFFREEFQPDTGMWVHKHPDRAGLERLYQKFYKVISS